MCGNRDTAKLQCFNDGSILKTNKMAADETQNGSPSPAITDVNVDRAKQLLKEDRRLLLRELSDSLNTIGKS